MSIYCDQAATSFPKPPEVVEAVVQAMTQASASPGRAAHRFALIASRAVFAAREAAAELLGVDDSSRIAFALNVTQALNVALSGYLRAGDHALTTSLEHNSVMRPLNFLAKSRGVEVEVVPATPDGFIDPREFRARLKDHTRLVVVNHGSNVIGTVQPLKEIKAAIGCVPLLVDAAQTAGVLNLAPVTDLSDMLAFTGHKGLFGPTGTGGLWVRPGLTVLPLFQGGTGSRSQHEEHPNFMPDALEAGTPNTHGLAGLAAGIRFVLATGLEAISRHETILVQRFLDGLSLIKGIRLYGPVEAAGHLGVVSINLQGWSSSDLAAILDREFGIMTRPGLHCAPRAHQTIGTFPRGTVRFSFGWFNGSAEIDEVLNALDRLSGRTV